MYLLVDELTNCSANLVSDVVDMSAALQSVDAVDEAHLLELVVLTEANANLPSVVDADKDRILSGRFLKRNVRRNSLPDQRLGGPTNLRVVEVEVHVRLERARHGSIVVGDLDALIAACQVTNSRANNVENVIISQCCPPEL